MLQVSTEHSLNLVECLPVRVEIVDEEWIISVRSSVELIVEVNNILECSLLYVQVVCSNLILSRSELIVIEVCKLLVKLNSNQVVNRLVESVLSSYKFAGVIVSCSSISTLNVPEFRRSSSIVCALSLVPQVFDKIEVLIDVLLSINDSSNINKSSEFLCRNTLVLLDHVSTSSILLLCFLSSSKECIIAVEVVASDNTIIFVASVDECFFLLEFITNLRILLHNVILLLCRLTLSIIILNELLLVLDFLLYLSEFVEKWLQCLISDVRTIVLGVDLVPKSHNGSTLLNHSLVSLEVVLSQCRQFLNGSCKSLYASSNLLGLIYCSTSCVSVFDSLQDILALLEVLTLRISILNQSEVIILVFILSVSNDKVFNLCEDVCIACIVLIVKLNLLGCVYFLQSFVCVEVSCRILSKCLQVISSLLEFSQTRVKTLNYIAFSILAVLTSLLDLLLSTFCSSIGSYSINLSLDFTSLSIDVLTCYLECILSFLQCFFNIHSSFFNFLGSSVLSLDESYLKISLAFEFNQIIINLVNVVLDNIQQSHCLNSLVCCNIISTCSNACYLSPLSIEIILDSSKSTNQISILQTEFTISVASLPVLSIMVVDTSLDRTDKLVGSVIENLGSVNLSVSL